MRETTHRHPVPPTGIDIAVGLVLGLFVGILALLLQVAMFAANGFVVGMVWLLIQVIPVMYIVWIRQIARRKAAYALLAARADYEHQQLCQGNIAVGVYGAFQPKGLS